MKNLTINETPVRTSNNFKINNITLEDLEIPTNVKNFENAEIICKSSKIEYDFSSENLTYGNGDVLEENVKKCANHRVKLTTSDETIKINYTFDDNNLSLINNIDIFANGSSNIIITYNSKTNKPCFHNGIIRLFANENSNVNIVVVNLLNNLSHNFDAIENTLDTNSNVNYTIIDIGGKYSVSNYFSNIIGENANNNLKTIYLGTENQVKDINYIAHLKGVKSQIDIDVQGALDGNAKKNFKGTIDFKKGCKKSKGNENEYCMLLSNTAKSKALPMLLCTESDVEGNHSTASGRANSDTLFYIMSRGICYKDAIKMIVRARFNNIIETIPDEDLKTEILSKIDEKLS